MKRRVWQRILSLALLLAMAIILVNPVTAQAKTRKLKLPFAKFNEPEVSYIETKAVTITKTGNYKVQLSRYQGDYSGFIKFIVPKTKRYAFTYSKARAKGKSSCLTWVHYAIPGETGEGIETNDGIININGYSKNYKGTNDFPFGYRVPGKDNKPKRTVYYNLTKGQVVYINIINNYYSTKGKKLTFNLKIK